MSLNHNLIYNLLDLRGIGIVQANKIMQTVQDTFKSANIDFLRNAIEKSLSLDQQKSFEEQLGKSKINNKFPVEFVSIIEDSYPLELKKAMAKNAPTILSYIGNYNLIREHKVGFCGSRKASEKGINVAADTVAQLVEKGYTIISGYASGIDMATHYNALKNNGNTILVLPEGINYFRIKRDLKDVWDWSRVLVISEFQPDAIWNTGRAMQRNNTIIGLSDIMILIEAGETGGSMDAGKKTLTLNKYLFAPVYEGMPENAKGNQLLLMQGAYPLKKSPVTNRANMTKIFELLETANKYHLI